MEKPGCVRLLSLFAAALVGFSMLNGNCAGRGQQKQDEAAQKEMPIATVYGQPVNISGALAQVADREQQMAQFGVPLAGDQKPKLLADAIENQVENAVVFKLAADQKIVVPDDQILTEAEKGLDGQVLTMKAQWVSEGKLKADASQADLEAVFKKEVGQALPDAKKSVLDRMKGELKDPAKAMNMKLGLMRQAMIDKFKAEIKLTDQELMKARDTFVIKRIFQPIGPGSKEKIEAAKKAIAGGTSFEQAIKTYSADPIDPKKPIETVTQEIPYTNIVTNPDMESLRVLKPGMVSDIISNSGGYLIVKVQSIKPGKVDLAKDKEALETSLKVPMAGAKVQSMIDELKKNLEVNWKSVSAQSLYTVNRALKDSKMPIPDLSRTLTAVIEGEPDTSKDLQMSGKLNAYAKFLAMDRFWQIADKEMRAKYGDKRLEILKSFVEEEESTRIRLMMVEALTESKNPSAIEELAATVDSITGFDASAVQTINQVQSALGSIQKNNVGTAETRKVVIDKIKDWQQAKVQFDQEQAEQKRLQAEETKRLEEERKKAEAEAKKEAEAAKKGQSSKPDPAPKKDAAPSSSDILKSGN